jgi:tRNA(fMet)-specific endonuclease VapC
MPLVRRLARTPGDEQCTTAISVAEISYAAARNGDGEVANRVRELIAAASTVLPFDHEAAEVYGSLRAHLERLGVRLDESSLRIAAIALSHDVTLVTASARLYDRVPGLRIENWLEPDDLVELDEADVEEHAASLNGAPALEGNGTVRHPGVVPQLEERVREAAEKATGPRGSLGA